MKTILYLGGLLLGGFVIYKLLGRNGGGGAAVPYSVSGGGAPGFFPPSSQAQRLVAQPASVLKQDNTAAILGFTAGAVKSLPDLIKGFAKVFSRSKPDPFTSVWTGNPNLPSTWSLNGSTAPGDYAPPLPANYGPIFPTYNSVPADVFNTYVPANFA